MEVASLRVATLHNHAGTVTHSRVAGRAIHVEALLATSQNIHRDWEGHAIALFPAREACIEIAIFAKLIACNRVLHLRTNRAAIRKKRGTALRQKFRLIVHILPAAKRRKQRNRCGGSDNKPRSACV
jgi:hypothetical protein